MTIIRHVLLLLLLIVFSLLNAELTYANTNFFTDEFDTLDNNTWEVFGQSHNEYVTTKSGALLISSPVGLYTSYVRNKKDLFPSTGDYSAEIRFQYSQLTYAGTGIVIGDSNPEYPVAYTDPVNSRIITIWQDMTSPLFALHNRLPLPTLSQQTTNDFHIVTIKNINQIYSVYYDGTLKYTATNNDRRSKSIWFGNPGPATVSQAWTQLKIDYVKVDEINDNTSFTISSDWDGSHREVPIDRTARITVKVVDRNGDPIKDASVSGEILNTGVGNLNITTGKTIENGEAYFQFTPAVESPAHFRFTVNGESKNFDMNVYRPPIVIVPGAGASLNIPKFLGNPLFNDLTWSWSPTAEDGWDSIIQTLDSQNYKVMPGYAVAYYDWRLSLHPQLSPNGVPEAETSIEKTIDSLLKNKPEGQRVTLLAHSFGGLVSRAFLKYDTQNRVNRLVTFGTPHKGSSHVFWIWYGGEMPPGGDSMFRIITDSILRVYKYKNPFGGIQAVRDSFPSFRNMLPIYDNYVKSPTGFFATRDLSFTNDVLYGSYTEDDFSRILDDRSIAFTSYAATGQKTFRDINVASPVTDATEWEDGKPLKNQVYADGDNSVLPESAEIGGGSTMRVIGSHGDLPNLSLPTLSSMLKLGSRVTSTKSSARSMVGALMLSPATVEIVDPQGTVVGSSHVWDEASSIKFAYARDLPTGIYTLRVTGTGSGPYTLYVPFASDSTFWTAEYTGTTKKDKVENYKVFIDSTLEGAGGKLVVTRVKVALGALNVPKKILPISFTFDIPKNFDSSSIEPTYLMVNSTKVPVLNSFINKKALTIRLDVNALVLGKAINWNDRELQLELVVPGKGSLLSSTLSFKLNWGLYRKYF